MSVKDVHCSSIAGDSKNDSPMKAAGFAAQATILNHSGQIGSGLAPVPDYHTAHIACKVTELKKRLIIILGKKKNLWKMAQSF